MDIISVLPDELLLQILSLVPTKTVFDAQVVSKRWRSLWRRLPSLNYDSAFHQSGNQCSEFVRRTLELLESPVLESFYFRASQTVTSSHVVLRNDLLAKRPLRELELVSTYNPDQTLLKRAIYQYQTLVILRLESLSLEDHYGNPISLRSLKVLQLRRVKYPSDESLSNLLSSLPSLNNLILERCVSVVHTTTLAIAVPYLKSLSVVRCPESCKTDLMMLKVNAPSLNYLNVEDYWRSVSFDQKMEKLVEADVNVTYINTEKLLTTLISAKRLSLCLVTSKITGNGSVCFDQLVRLDICTCQHGWWSLLERIFLDSPKLRFLKLYQKHCFGIIDPTVRWKEPRYVPECFASHLETFEWRDYEGTEDEKALASYILRNAGRLKIATIYPQISLPDRRMHRILKNFMRKELENLCPCLLTCNLVFK